MNAELQDNSKHSEFEELSHEAFRVFDGIGVNHSNRLDVFLERVLQQGHKIADKLYWVGLRAAYVGTCDLGSIDRWCVKALFQSERNDREYLMDPEERGLLKSLPDVVTIYRGMTELERDSKEFGLSWTLSQDVAAFFAHKYQRSFRFKNACKCVYSLDVPKQRIMAYLNDRKEQEVIYEHPTPAYRGVSLLFKNL